LCPWLIGDGPRVCNNRTVLWAVKYPPPLSSGPPCPMYTPRSDRTFFHRLCTKVSKLPPCPVYGGRSDRTFFFHRAVHWTRGGGYFPLGSCAAQGSWLWCREALWCSTIGVRAPLYSAGANGGELLLSGQYELLMAVHLASPKDVFLGTFFF
jgi:hypothetical protein